MTAKEKAKELYEKILYGFKHTIHVHTAKQISLIAVNEILNEYPSQCPKDSYEMERHLYWIEVKKEIEKL